MSRLPPIAFKRPGSSPAARRARAAESFQTAAECIGPIEHGMSLFAITRGQFSMVDAVLHVLHCTGPAVVSFWTWTVAEYEVDSFTALRNDGRITAGTLMIDEGARVKNLKLINAWRGSYGPASVRYIDNHAKIATVEGGGFRVLLRGSMNLNANARFEQLDVTEGGPDFDLVRQVESEIPILHDDASAADVREASRCGKLGQSAMFDAFKDVKPWKP